MKNRDWFKFGIWTVYVVVCVVVAWLIWIMTLDTGFPFSPEWKRMTGGEIFTVIGFSFAVFGVGQGILRWLATPRLVLEPYSSKPLPLRLPEYAVHHLKIWNHEMHWLLRPLVLRTAPEGCQIKFRYSKLNEETGKYEILKFLNKKLNEETREYELAPIDEWLLGRWGDNAEPITQFIMQDQNGNLQVGAIPNQSALITNRRLPKLFPTETEGQVDAYPFTVAFAIKKKSELDFYHFNEESYVSDGTWTNSWCNPRWKLEKGLYKIEVRITGYGLTAAQAVTFKLCNLGREHDEFTLDIFKDEQVPEPTPSIPTS